MKRSRYKAGLHSSTVVIEGLAPFGDYVWDEASRSVHQEFFMFCKKTAHGLFREQLRRGIDKYGEPLAPIAESTRRKGRHRSYTGRGSANNPPLVPALGESRTIKWLRSSINYARQSIALFWSHGWGTILSYHGDGEVSNAPARDVRGLAPMYERRLRTEADSYWRRMRSRVRREVDEGAPPEPTGERRKWAARRLPAVPTARTRPTRPIVPAGPRVAISKGSRFDIENAIISTGATRAQIEQATREGTFSGFKRLTR